MCIIYEHKQILSRELNWGDVQIRNSTKWLYALIICEEKDHCFEKKGIFVNLKDSIYKTICQMIIMQQSNLKFKKK